MRRLFGSWLLVWCCCASAPAHDIPSDVTVHSFVKPAGDRLQLLVRLPLRALRDIDFPEQSGGWLDIARLTPLLPDAASLWISEPCQIYEGDERLPKPRVAAVQVSFESDRSFASFDQALAHITGPPLPNDSKLVWDQAMFDVLLEYPIHSDRSAFSIRPGLER